MNDINPLQDRSFMDAIYDRQGRRISIEEWGRLRKIPGYKVVKQTTLNALWVSTVWLGLDHGWGRAGDQPVIFETMVFEDGGGDKEYQGLRKLLDEDYSPYSELDSARYSTEEEALAGHEAMVAKWSRPQ